MGTAAQTQEAIRQLEERLRRYPEARYPVQHATAQFHLGMTLSGAGRAEEAESALRTAVRLFNPDHLPVEHAKALNALGAALRLQGRPDDAAAAFERSVRLFEAARLELETGAALYNFGLALRDVGNNEGAAPCLERARAIFASRKLISHEAAAAGELGAARLAGGDPEAAIEPLGAAMSLADRAGDQPGVGRVANTLGLAHLASHRWADAIESFRMAAAAHPRSIRPHDYSMAKANLAVAYEQAGDEARARLSALQALAAPSVPEAVELQAEGVTARLGSGPGDVVITLDDEPRDRWAAVVREDLARWAHSSPREQRVEAAAWIDSQLRRPGAGADLAEALLAALLELPPGAMNALVTAMLQALQEHPPEDRERFREEGKQAMARFHVPQLLRLRDIFNRLAVELGQEARW